MQPMSASHFTTTHWPMLKFGGVSSSVESGLPSTSSLSNSLMRKTLNSPSDVLSSISFSGEYSACIWCALSTVSIPSHNVCGSCDLASKLNYVTGDELDMNCFDWALSEPNRITPVSVVCVAILCPHTDLVTVPPTESKPSMN